MIGNTEDETNNSHSNSILSHEKCKHHSDKNCDKTETSFHTMLNGGDDKYWAEDEMSSSDSQLHVNKRKRRHSVTHRNLKYKKFQDKYMSSSSDFSSSKNTFHKPKRPRKKKKLPHNDRATTSRLSTSDSRNISIRSQRGSKFRFFSNKKK